MALFLDVGPDDLVRIGENLVFTVERKSGSRARLRFVGGERVEMIRHGRDLDVAPPPPEVANVRR